MTLKLKHGGPVFDGLWVKRKKFEKTQGQVFLQEQGRVSGGWIFILLYRNLTFSGSKYYTKTMYDHTVDYCLAPINLIRWDKDGS